MSTPSDDFKELVRTIGVFTYPGGMVRPEIEAILNMDPCDLLNEAAAAITSLVQERDSAREQEADWRRWLREVLVDFRVEYDDHKIGLRLALTDALAAETLKRRQVEHERDCIVESLAALQERGG